ncbi:uncharacterized protein LOC1270157 isoform X1 [Anopheles gambiae]|uniref:uncharacterized protein LOC1270157 isoform X1 n=2 Tax=Anopheles gambiae TaxID=7165 RepID=UPI002AC97E22|nr:uncharacterized protein LOC1270157 isoform X1 [Anopheles gambiae]XP_061506572.1 uncharacterized protein LOC1270157 isoform X1 [Anopheles gambiae]XP_308832.4 uncharacterized protein LOC1270157 isoform X1 [Anopheles gambiae]
MSGTSSVPGGVVVPPSPVSLHAQTKQVQQHLVNEIPVPVSYIANCRLCLGTHFGTRCTTIIDAPLINMMRQVFPVMIENRVGLPMNVCTECIKTVEAFYIYSRQVLENQNRLLATLPDVIRPVQNNDGVECRENPVSTQEPQENDLREEPEAPIDTDLLIKIEKDDEQEGSDPLATTEDIVFDVIDEIPDFKLEEEAIDLFELNSDAGMDPLLKETTNPLEINPDAGINLQLEVKEEMLTDPSPDSVADSETLVQDSLVKEKPKKQSKRNVPIKCRFFDRPLNFCPVHSIWFELKQISSESELIEMNRRLKDDKFMQQLINCFQHIAEESSWVDLMNKSMDILFDVDFLASCDWRNVEGKIPMQHHLKIHELFTRLDTPKGKKLAGKIQSFFIVKIQLARRRAQESLEGEFQSDELPSENQVEAILRNLAPKSGEENALQAQVSTFAQRLKKRRRIHPSVREVLIQARNNCCPLKLKQIRSLPELIEFNRRLEDEQFTKQIIKYLQYETKEPRADLLMNKSLDMLVDKHFFATCNWRADDRHSLKQHSKFLELFGRLGASEGTKLPGIKVAAYFKHRLTYVKQRVKFYNPSSGTPDEANSNGDTELHEENILRDSIGDTPCKSVEESVEQAQDTDFRNVQKKRNIKAPMRFVRFNSGASSCNVPAKLDLRQCTSEPEIAELNRRLEDEEYMKQIVSYIQYETGESRPDRLMKKSFDILFRRRFFAGVCWTGTGEKIAFKHNSNILELFARLGASNGLNASSEQVKKFFHIRCKNAVKLVTGKRSG